MAEFNCLAAFFMANYGNSWGFLEKNERLSFSAQSPKGDSVGWLSELI